MLRAVRFADPLSPSVVEGPVALRAARGEVVSFAVGIDADAGFRRRGRAQLRLRAPAHVSGQDRIPLAAVSAWRVVFLPADARRAAFVRDAGAAPAAMRVPRALVPLRLDHGGATPLESLRGAGEREMRSPPDAAIVWFDLRVAATAAPGRYEGACDLVDAGRVRASVPIALDVEEFVLPDDRHLHIFGDATWDDLRRLFPAQFERIRPHLLNRGLPDHQPAVALLDGMVRLAHDHRVNLCVPQLAPVVKWPVGRGPEADWSDFDSVVAPWLGGTMFANGVPAGFWPLPLPEKFDRLDLPSRIEYAQAAATHFDTMDWLARSALLIDRPAAGRLSLLQSVETSQYAARFLAAHHRLRVMAPLEEEQVHLATPQSPTRIAPEDVDRLIFLAPGLVRRPPLQRLPEGVHLKYLDIGATADMTACAGGAADERQTRLWTALAFVRDARLLRWPEVLPSERSPDEPADPAAPCWFMPGAWFGVEGVVPTLQLKWLRRAQQDYEYLRLAARQGHADRAAAIARLICRPVELRAAQAVDPLYSLFTGTVDQRSWDEMLTLLARTVHLSQPGRPPDEAARRQLEYDLAAWMERQQRPLMLARGVEWSLGPVDSRGDRWVRCAVAVDLYNAAPPRPARGRLAWKQLADGWRAADDGTTVPAPGECTVTSHTLEARADIETVAMPPRGPWVLGYTEGHGGRSFALPLVTPAARCGPRRGPPPRIDGSLGDWVAVDAIHDGRLVRMLSRPSVQRQELLWADAPSAVYANWTPSHLYLGFRVEGADTSPARAETSFVAYQCRRAWGEDVCEVLVQAIYGDNTVGPVLHLACKPRGQIEVSRRLDPRTSARPWQAFEGSGVRYAATLDGDTWRGELAVPWEAANAPGETRRPLALRFNFAHHQRRSAQSASWAGPVDFGRDDSFTGLLRLCDDAPQRR